MVLFTALTALIVEGLYIAETEKGLTDILKDEVYLKISSMVYMYIC